MKVIETHWEQKNLGMKSYEVVLTSEDSVSEFLKLEQELVKRGAKYIVLKAPINRPDFLFEIPGADYTFVEATFSLTLKKRDYVCPSYLERFDRGLQVRTVTSDDDKARVYNEISKGMFTTDRVSIDSRFPQGTGSLRYLNWVKDLVAAGHGLYEVFSKDKPLGFFQLEKIDSTKVRGVVSGIYEEFSQSGMGSLISKKILDFSWSSGYQTYYASAVTNNLKSLRSNLIFGSQITNISYNYVKHVA